MPAGTDGPRARSLPKAAALSLAGLLGGAVLDVQPRPEASELLKQVRSTYSSFQSFRDQGEIEAVHSFTGAVETHRFDLAMSAAGGYRFTLQAVDLPCSQKGTVLVRPGAASRSVARGSDW